MGKSGRAGLALLAAVAMAGPLQARNTAAYFSIDPGYHWYDTTQLIIDKDPSTPDSELVPTPGFMPELRLGINVGGYGGAEAFIAGHWWGSGNQAGGGGVAGGLLRLTPLEFFQHLWRPIENRPVDLGFSFGAGYTIVGEDFAYQGWFLQYGVDLNVFILPFLAVGFELPIRQMLYAPFRYTHFGNSRGLCTRGGTAYDRDGREVHRTADRELNLPDGTNLGAVQVDADGKVTGNFILTEVESSEVDGMCSGPAPEVWQYTPMVKFTFLVDFGI